ncbi:YciI family protein [Amycolatopsis suaedae]|uniref:YciI family protein n=1 Tax=Amycolatopsis suaedae TaxID=2510978 RepID=A0A4Q7JDS5_9PSEU|nr:YciI family protein [Amycolatopsis suaedae]RZQ66050.1 YciI family protein [Amycolatopsis suaedae]
MRFMVMVMSDENTEAGALPTEEDLRCMTEFNEELVKAGIMLAGDGLHPSSKGARVRFSEGGRATVIDGPFAEAKELVAGYWILEVSSKEECLEWVKRIPFTSGEVQVRQIFEIDEFGDQMTPELKDKNKNLKVATGQE